MQNNNKKSWIFLGVVVIILVVTVILTGNKNKTATDNIIKIGVVGPMTGPRSSLGEGLHQSILLAQKDYGPTKKQYQFIFEDSVGDAVKAASAVEKLISVDHVNALISISSQDGNIVKTRAEEMHIPHFGIASDEKIEEGDYNFAHWVSSEIQAKLLVQQLQKQGIKRVAFLMEQNDAWIAIKKSFEQAISGTDIQIVYSEDFTKDVMDFRNTLENVKKANPDIVMIESFSPMLEIIGKQARQVGITAPLTSQVAFELAKDKKPFEGQWYVSGTPSTDDFYTKFQQQTGYVPTAGANYGYDIVQILFSIFDNTKNTSGESIARSIRQFDYSTIKSAVGTLRGINEQGRVISDAAILVIKDGKPAKYEPN